VKSVANHRISEAACVSELRRVAALLGQNTLTMGEFARHGSMCGRTVCERFGTWGRALRKAGLAWRHNAWHETPLAVLARTFVQATVELGRLPTCTELERHTGYERKTLSDRWGGYVAFKRTALAHLLAPEKRLAVGPEVRALLEAEARALNRGVGQPARTVHRPDPQRLDFRGFAHAPTCEQGVVLLFGAVARDLGFEILHIQAAFPDCLALREGQPCRIEFELTSRDFLRHGHAPAGCDLIVCWRHTWADCPVVVLELESAIRKLDGWR
jgi:hypothetical protein